MFPMRRCKMHLKKYREVLRKRKAALVLISTGSSSCLACVALAHTSDQGNFLNSMTLSRDKDRRE